MAPPNCRNAGRTWAKHLDARDMASMQEMAAEYRAAAAKLAMRIAEKKAAGASRKELYPLLEALGDIREAQRLISGYYDLPRSGPLAAADWRARRTTDDH